MKSAWVSPVQLLQCSMIDRIPPTLLTCVPEIRGLPTEAGQAPAVPTTSTPHKISLAAVSYCDSYFRGKVNVKLF